MDACSYCKSTIANGRHVCIGVVLDNHARDLVDPRHVVDARHLSLAETALLGSLLVLIALLSIGIVV